MPDDIFVNVCTLTGGRTLTKPICSPPPPPSYFSLATGLRIRELKVPSDRFSFPEPTICSVSGGIVGLWGSAITRRMNSPARLVRAVWQPRSQGLSPLPPLSTREAEERDPGNEVGCLAIDRDVTT